MARVKALDDGQALNTHGGDPFARQILRLRKLGPRSGVQGRGM
jgi:hypothetical protein